MHRFFVSTVFAVALSLSVSIPAELSSGNSAVRSEESCGESKGYCRRQGHQHKAAGFGKSWRWSRFSNRSHTAKPAAAAPLVVDSEVRRVLREPRPRDFAPVDFDQPCGMHKEARELAGNDGYSHVDVRRSGQD